MAASSLRLVTFNLVTRSVVWFRPTLIIAGHRRSYNTMPKDDLYDQSWPSIFLSPKISSVSFDMEMTDENRNLKVYTPKLARNWDDYSHKGLRIALEMPGGLKKEEMMTACNVEHNNLLIKEEMKDGNIMANIIANIVASFRDIDAKRSWAYYSMFYDRSILGKGLCPLIAMMSPMINSFSIFKKETAESLEIDMCIPGDNDTMKLTTQGLRVSLYMQGSKRKDIRTYFDYDTFFIEGKTNNRHYITGIRLPEGVRKKHNMIRKKMVCGFFYAFIPCCVKKEELGVINGQKS